MDEDSTDFKSTSAKPVTPSEPTQVAPAPLETNSEEVSKEGNPDRG